MPLKDLPKFECLWHEDEDGNILDLDWHNEPPTIPDGDVNVYQHSSFLVVEDSICYANNTRHAKWPVRLLAWCIQKMPDSWKKRSGQFMEGHMSLNFGYPVIKALVETHGWGFSDAAVAAANMCERCLNLALEEAGEVVGHGITDVTHCKYCAYMDPEHHQKYLLKACYRAFKYGRDIAAEYRYITKEYPSA